MNVRLTIVMCGTIAHRSVALNQRDSVAMIAAFKGNEEPVWKFPLDVLVQLWAPSFSKTLRSASTENNHAHFLSRIGEPHGDS